MSLAYQLYKVHKKNRRGLTEKEIIATTNKETDFWFMKNEPKSDFIYHGFLLQLKNKSTFDSWNMNRNANLLTIASLAWLNPTVTALLTATSEVKNEPKWDGTYHCFFGFAEAHSDSTAQGDFRCLCRSEGCNGRSLRCQLLTAPKTTS